MRKPAIILALAVLLASCVGIEGPIGPPGPQGPPGGIQKNVVNITVFSNHWVKQYVNGYFTSFAYEIEIPELTTTLFYESLYHMYFVWQDGNTPVQEALPYTIFNERPNGEGWQQTIACDYSPRFVTLYVRNSDFNEDPPPTMNFRFVLLR